jgi:L-seryl-tRNA(Ser) seleniumtransferase
VLGSAELVTVLQRHPLARALRVDKLTLAALEATLRGPATPTAQALSTDPSELHRRARAIATALAARGIDAMAVTSQATVGGGGAPGVMLKSAAVSLPERYAALLRAAHPAVLGRIERGRCLLDLRAVPAERDTAVRDAVLACMS